MARGRVRIAKHFTTRERRTVPFIQELEPKGDRWLFEGESASVLGVLPEFLATRAGKDERALTLSLLAFDRFRGPSPEPQLLDLNDTESVFEREQSVVLERSWPPPWPPVPAALAAWLGDSRRE
jgi:hypothetical protein